MVFDHTLTAALTAAIETTVNKALQYDPASRQKVSKLNNILAIELTIPSLCFYMHGYEDGIRVMAHCEAPVSAHLTGTPIALLSLLQQPASLAKSGVALAGDVGLLQQWQHILGELDIDWEDAISEVLGDIAGPLVAKGIHIKTAWVKEQLQEHQRLISEYLPEEIGILPAKEEAKQFFKGIDSLKLDVDRLSARVKQLQEQLGTEKL